jgi:hypothetical protein
MRADSAILQRLIHMTCWFTPLILRLGANQHLTHPGDIVFRHACAMGLEGIVSKRLAQVQEPGGARGAAGGGGGLGTLTAGRKSFKAPLR